MTREEAINAYMDKFGGFPFMTTRGLPDQVIIKLVEDALSTGEEIAIELDPGCDC